jgi:hypothetical protein
MAAARRDGGAAAVAVRSWAGGWRGKKWASARKGLRAELRKGRNGRKFFFLNLLAFETKPPITKILVQQHACMNIF